MGLITALRAKYTTYKLEQKYTRRREKRKTFVSNATYVDGEYIYAVAATTIPAGPKHAATTTTTTVNIASARHGGADWFPQQSKRHPLTGKAHDALKLRPHGS